MKLGPNPAADLETVLLQLSRLDPYSLRHACEGMSIMGAPGASKSTSSGAAILTALLATGAGGLIACVKAGERARVEAMARKSGRGDSLIVVEPGGPWRCNLLDYVLRRPGVKGSRVEQVVNLLIAIVDVAERGESVDAGKNEAFWQRSLKVRIRNAVEVFIAAGERLSVEAMHRFMQSAPSTHEQVQEAGWQAESTCYRLIQKGLDGYASMSARQRSDFDLAATYWLREVIDFPEETRGSIAATWSAAADLLMRGQLADLFGTDTTFVPDLSFGGVGGAVIVLDLPVKVYGQAGAVLQAAFKHVWQMAAEQREIGPDSPVAFLYIDEAQEIVSESDAFFFATARSARIASVLISQNLSNYYSALGGEQGRHRVEAMLANLCTHVWHANGHALTNKWASDMVAEHTATRYGWSRDQTGRGSGSGTEAIEKKLRQSVFTELAKGGPPSWTAEAIWFQGGRIFGASGETYLRLAFRQMLV